jgi:DNA-directed RNA polymerase specialized sigma24 family protein
MMDGRARLQAIHERVLSGDPSASSDLFLALQRSLARVVYGRHRTGRLSWEDAGDLATDAIVAYLGAPGRFDFARASLFSYLVLIADRDALNLIRDRATKKKNLARFVELAATDGNVTDDPGDRRLDAERLLRNHWDKIVEDETDRRVLELMLNGEQETAAYAAALGVSHLAPADQRNLVKQRRDRIEKRLKRLGESL